MPKEAERQMDRTIYSPVETQRLAQFQHIIHKSNEISQRLSDGENLSLLRQQADGTQVEIFPITGRVVGAMKGIAFNMYTEYFAKVPKLKSAALDISAAEKLLRTEAQGITEDNFNKIWSPVKK